MIQPDVRSLYKYCSSDRAVEILRNKKIWYSAMSEFNDPFESRYAIDNSASPEVLIALAIKHFSANDVSFDEIIQKLRSEYIVNSYAGISVKPDKIEEIRKTITSFEQSLSSIKVLSLSQDPKNILMWSHYGENHKGACIEFDRDEDEDCGDNRYSMPVIYSDTYPTFNLAEILVDGDALKKKLILTKSFHWSYELEWRVWKQLSTVSGNVKNGQLNALPGKVKSIILGCKWNGNIEDIKFLAKDHGAVIMQAKIVDGRYAIGLETMSDAF